MQALDILLTASFWVAAIRIASPLIFATLGELICERAGVLNLCIEGIMTLGAMVGWLAVYEGAYLWTGVALAAVAGMAMGRCLAAWGVGHDASDQALPCDVWNGVLEDGIHLLQLVGMPSGGPQRDRREYCGYGTC